jgi:hypothetical protein
MVALECDSLHPPTARVRILQVKRKCKYPKDEWESSCYGKVSQSNKQAEVRRDDEYNQ